MKRKLMAFFSETEAVGIFVPGCGSMQARGLANKSLPLIRITPRGYEHEAARFYNRFGSDKNPTIQ